MTDNIWTRFKRRFTRSLGTDIAIRRMEAAEEKHEREFTAQRERALAGEQDVQEFLRTSALEEKAHARALNAMAGPPNPKTALDTILKRERWHGRGGSWVADAIYGVNDGLGAVFGIVSGVAGATNNQQHYRFDFRSRRNARLRFVDGRRRLSRGQKRSAKCTKRKSRAKKPRSKKIPRKKSKRWRSSISCRDSAPEESQKMAERLAENPEQLVQAMAQSELGLSEHRFPQSLEIGGFGLRFRPRSARSFPSFRFFS